MKDGIAMVASSASADETTHIPVRTQRVHFRNKIANDLEDVVRKAIAYASDDP